MTTGFGNVTIDLSRAPIAQAEDSSASRTGATTTTGAKPRTPAKLRAEPQGVRYTGVRALASELGVKAGHLSMILHGRRPAGKRIREALRARGVNVMGWREWERAHGQADGQAEHSSAIRTGGAMAQQ